jgi:hypothetical protein
MVETQPGHFLGGGKVAGRGCDLNDAKVKCSSMA